MTIGVKGKENLDRRSDAGSKCNIGLQAVKTIRLWAYHKSLPLTRSHSKRVREIEMERCIDIRAHSDKHTHTQKIISSWQVSQSQV